MLLLTIPQRIFILVLHHTFVFFFMYLYSMVSLLHKNVYIICCSLCLVFYLFCNRNIYFIPQSEYKTIISPSNYVSTTPRSIFCFSIIFFFFVFKTHFRRFGSDILSIFAIVIFRLFDWNCIWYTPGNLWNREKNHVII